MGAAASTSKPMLQPGVMLCKECKKTLVDQPVKGSVPDVGETQATTHIIANHSTSKSASMPSVPIMSVHARELVVQFAGEANVTKEMPSGVSPQLAVFSWLSMAPKPSTPCFDTLQRCFPGALPGTAIVKRSTSALRELGITPDNSIYGQSICPDEINNEKGDLASLMADYWGSCFPMGGIGGAPYVGKTGFMAFSHHVPDNGNVVILFGPHIAISESGELGKYKRIGQSCESTACGACLAAFGACKDGAVGDPDPSDVEQCWLKEKINERMADITAASEPVASLTHAAYEAIKEEMLKIVNTNFGSGKLVLIGGLQINMPAPYEDHFLPLMFQMCSKSEKDTSDILAKLLI